MLDHYGQVKAATQADFKTPLPKFQGETLPYASCGYTGPQLRAAYEGDSEPRPARASTVAITDAYAVADDRRGRATPTRRATATAPTTAAS